MKKTALIFILILSLALCGCSGTGQKTAEEKAVGEAVEKAESGEYKLRDNKLLYKDSDADKVVTMYLTVSSGNSGENTDHTWSEINTYSVYDYERMGADRYKVEGLLQAGDENGPLPGEVGYNQVSPNCTVQIRGQSSSLQPVKNYKISLKDNKGTWNGQSTIALNKHVSDGLRFRNKLAYDLIAGIDKIVGLRTTFVHLYVKDTTEGGNGKFTDYGLYTQVEQLNKTALKARGLDNKGHLYKINLFEFYRYEDIIKLKSDPSYDEKAFEEIIETKGDDDHTKLIKMLEDVNNYSLSIDSVLEKHFDIENMSYWMAFQILMGNIDTQNRNVYIYSPLNIDKWYFIPWDNDGSLTRTEYELKNRSDYLEWESGVSNYWGNVLFKRALKSEKYRSALDAAIEDLRGYLTKERIDKLAEKYSGIVKPYVYKNPDIIHANVTPSQYDYLVKSISSEIDTNYNLYKESYKKPLPFFIGTPQKKENKLYIECDASYDFNGENLTYNITVARDVNFASVIAKTEGARIPAIEIDMLPKGQYFIKATVTNESGYTQTAFDCYILEAGKAYGVKCFYIDENGNVVEDVYEEK